MHSDLRSAIENYSNNSNNSKLFFKCPSHPTQQEMAEKPRLKHIPGRFYSRLLSQWVKTSRFEGFSFRKCVVVRDVHASESGREYQTHPIYILLVLISGGTSSSGRKALGFGEKRASRYPGGCPLRAFQFNGLADSPLARPPALPPCVPSKGRRKQQHEKREKLTLGQWADHRGIRLTELLPKDPE